VGHPRGAREAFTRARYHVWHDQAVNLPYSRLPVSERADVLRPGGAISLLSSDGEDPLGLRSTCQGAEVRIEAAAGRPPRIFLHGLDEPEGVLLPRALEEERNGALGEQRSCLPLRS
jgi:hypothetical protein